MGILDELDNNRYRAITELIKNDEIYDKKRNVLTAIDAFKLFHRDYLKLIFFLAPLTEKLGNNIEILDIDFNQGMQDDTILVIKYLKDDKQEYISISNMDLGQIDISTSDKNIDNEDFVIDNYQLILNIFDSIDRYDLDQRIEVPTTSKKYIISSFADTFTIKDSESKLFSIVGKQSLYTKQGIIVNKIICNYPKLKELLENNENTLNIYNHIHIYEEDLDKVLTKKLT